MNRRIVARRPDGFTLVELLVVIAIIGILISLLIPAVQAARESGRRLQCSNNLRQIGFACLTFEDTYKVLPDGGELYWLDRTMRGSQPAVAPAQNWGWEYQILPYLEQGSVYKNPVDAQVAQTPIHTYFCPSRRSPQAVPETHPPIPPYNPGEIRAMTDYAGNGGTDAAGDNGGPIRGNGKDGTIVRRPNGSPDRSAAVKMGMITDGTSHTLLAGEKCLNSGRIREWQPDDDEGFVAGWDYDVIRWGRFQPSQDWYDVTSASAYNTNSFVTLRSSFGSAHYGAFNCVLCDGSVLPVSYNVQLTVFECLSSRNDGHVVSSADLTP